MLPAADFDAFAVRPSRSVFDALVAAFLDVFFVVLRCESALPAAVFDVVDVDLLRSVFDAFFAAFAPVFFVAMVSPWIES